jgi:hypothetical protein
MPALNAARPARAVRDDCVTPASGIPPYKALLVDIVFRRRTAQRVLDVLMRGRLADPQPSDLTVRRSRR